MPQSTKPPLSVDNLANRLPEREEPKLFAERIDKYLTTFRESLGKRVFGAQTEQFSSAASRRGYNLVLSARSFDDHVMTGIGDTKLVMPADAVDVISHINEGTELLGTTTFTDVVNRYYEELEKPLVAVVKKLKTGGPDYLMEGVHHYREEAAQDLELLLRKLKEGSQVSEEQLGARSQRYEAVDSSRPRGFKETIRGMQAVDPEHIEEVNRLKITTSLQDIVESITDKGDVERQGQAVMIITSDLLHHLSKNLGEKGLKVIGEPGNRGLDRLPDGPLHQMEAMMAILNTVLADYENMVTVHRDIIGGVGAEQRRVTRPHPVPLMRIKNGSTSS